MSEHGNVEALDDIDLSLLEARVQSLRRDGIDSAFSLVGHELRPHLMDPEKSPLPSSVQAALLAEGEQPQAAFRAASSDDLGIGKSFWGIYSKQLRASICNRDGELYKLLASEGKTSTKAVIAALATTIGAGTAFAGLICGIAVILLEIGVRGILRMDRGRCGWTGAGQESLKARLFTRCRSASRTLRCGAVASGGSGRGKRHGSRPSPRAARGRLPTPIPLRTGR
jgi:hypothetical protein